MDIKSEIVKAALLPILSRTATATGTAVDLKDAAADNLSVLLHSGAASAGTEPTLDTVIEHSDDNVTFTPVTGGAFAEVSTVAGTQELAIAARALKRYVRAVATHDSSAGTPTFTYGVFLQYRKKYL